MLTGTVSCKDIATYTSPYGLLNSIQANVGDVYYINQKDKFVGYIFHEKVDSSDVTIDSEVNSLVIAADIDLSADLDAETPKIKLLSTKIEQQLERNSKLKLIKPSRVRLKNPYKFLNRIESNYASTFGNLNNADVMFMAVTSVVLADSLALQTQNSDSTTTGIQTLKIDGFTIKLTSNCDALIDVEGNKAGVFFKSVFFTYDPQTKRLAPYTQLFDFKGYHVNTVNQ
jgi:hypothetical protein